MNDSGRMNEDGAATVTNIKSTLLEPSFLATLKDFNVSKEQLEVVEPIYQKVSYIFLLYLFAHM